MKILAELRRRVLGAFRTSPTLNYAALCLLFPAGRVRSASRHRLRYYVLQWRLSHRRRYGSRNGNPLHGWKLFGVFPKRRIALSFAATFPPDPIFTPTDFDSASLFFDSAPLEFETGSGITNFPAVDTCPCYDLFFDESGPYTWETIPFGGGDPSGTYTIAAVPEPSSFILLVGGVVLLGFLSRGKLRLGGSSQRTPDPTAQT